MVDFDKDLGGTATLIEEDFRPAVDGSGYSDVQQPRLLLREVDPDRFSAALMGAQNMFETGGAKGVQQYLSEMFQEFGPQVHSDILRRLQERRNTGVRFNRQSHIINETFRNVCNGSGSHDGKTQK